MNAIHTKNDVSVSIEALRSAKPANDARLSRVVSDLDPFTRCYRRFTRQLRAACAQYVERQDVDDLVQDVWTVAAQSPAKLAQSDARTLSWLIGIAKRCAPAYESMNARMVPLDELLERERGDDREGEEPFEEIPW